LSKIVAIILLTATSISSQDLRSRATFKLLMCFRAPRQSESILSLMLCGRFWISKGLCIRPELLLNPISLFLNNLATDTSFFILTLCIFDDMCILCFVEKEIQLLNMKPSMFSNYYPGSLPYLALLKNAQRYLHFCVDFEC